jgi:hypothetical protein
MWVGIKALVLDFYNQGRQQLKEVKQCSILFVDEKSF